MSVENPGGKRLWRGWYVCECVTLIYPIMEDRMKAAGVLSGAQGFQGGYNAGGVSASAGTHDGGGTTDHSLDSDTQLRIQRECGAAAWGRTPAEGFDYHCHSVLNGCEHLSSGAYDQTVDYRNGRNGLANNGPDTGPDVPYITWKDAYYKYAGQAGDTGGVLGMTDYRSFYTAKDQKITADDEWHLVKLNDDGDTSLAFKGEAYSVVTSVGVSGGAPASFRYALVSVVDNGPDKVDSWYPVITDPGSVPLAWVGSIGDSSDKRLRLYVNAKQNITISTVTAKCLYG